MGKTKTNHELNLPVRQTRAALTAIDQNRQLTSVVFDENAAVHL